jgi:hypothetical protein
MMNVERNFTGKLEDWLKAVSDDLDATDQSQHPDIHLLRRTEKRTIMNVIRLWNASDEKQYYTSRWEPATGADDGA